MQIIPVLRVAAGIVRCLYSKTSPLQADRSASSHGSCCLRTPSFGILRCDRPADQRNCLDAEKPERTHYIDMI